MIDMQHLWLYSLVAQQRDGAELGAMKREAETLANLLDCDVVFTFGGRAYLCRPVTGWIDFPQATEPAEVAESP